MEFAQMVGEEGEGMRKPLSLCSSLSTPILFFTFCLFPEKKKNITHRKIQQTHFREGKKNQWLSGKISTWKPPSSDWVCRELRRTINLLRSTEPIPTKELCRPTTRTHRNPAGKLTPIPPNATKKIPLPPRHKLWGGRR